jgi:hypothetical protein
MSTRTLIRDRDGDLIDPHAHDTHWCTNGWQGEDHQGRPRPCPTCRAETITLMRAAHSRINRWK